MSSKQRWKIHMKNMEVIIRIGIHAHEKEPQTVLVSALVEGDYPARPKSIKECFNYDQIHEFVAKWPAQDHVWLLETCVSDLLTHIFEVDEAVQCATVSVCKPNIFPNAESVGVEAQWTRADFERFRTN